MISHQVFRPLEVPADSINNVERIKVAPGVLTTAGQWQVKVIHRGGTAQSFGLVLVADATSTPKSDLATYNGSIVPSSQNPLKNDVITLQLGWINQGTLASNSFHVTLEDLTANTTLFDADRSGLGAGIVDSFLLQHQFLTTGTHTLRLSIDTLNQVPEMNDGVTGENNNIWTQDIQVTALGVRVVALDAGGSAPISSIDRAASASKVFDVLNDTGIDIPIHILHEGTGQQAVTLSVTNVQMPQPRSTRLFARTRRLLDQNVSQKSGPHIVIEGQGEVGDYKMLTVFIWRTSMQTCQTPPLPRYARAGTFVSRCRRSLPITTHGISHPTHHHRGS